VSSALSEEMGCSASRSIRTSAPRAFYTSLAPGDNDPSERLVRYRVGTDLNAADPASGHRAHGKEYGIPPDNPFADGIAGASEVFVLGLRNPALVARVPGMCRDCPSDLSPPVCDRGETRVPQIVSEYRRNQVELLSWRCYGKDVVRRRAQLDFRFPKHGGKRRGAGRPPKNPKRSSEPHKKRAEFARWQAFHITLRVDHRVSELRRRDAYHAIRKAMYVIQPRAGFRIIHISLERGHVHLIIEASSHDALARGMQAFQISAAKRLNAARRGERRRGNVFVDRYHAVRITSPTQARNAIRYVLCNWRHHHADKSTELRGWRVDYFSSGPTFSGWAEYGRHREPFPTHAEYQPLPVSDPRTWFLSHGWMKVGPISLLDEP
jgi:putative transposase